MQGCRGRIPARNRGVSGVPGVPGGPMGVPGGSWGPARQNNLGPW